MKILVDTNLVVSALIADGRPREIIDWAAAQEERLVYSQRLLDEIRSVGGRPKFRRYFTVDDLQLEMDRMISAGQWIPDRPEEQIPHVCRDPKDDYLLAVCEDGQVDMLVSGDKGVLAVERDGLRVATPTEALRVLVDVGLMDGDSYGTCG